jgi:hypothetical protein
LAAGTTAIREGSRQENNNGGGDRSASLHLAFMDNVDYPSLGVKSVAAASI